MINVTLHQNEMTVTGEVAEGDIYPGLCCTGHDWTVTLTLLSVWGWCSNPDCTAGGLVGSDENTYRGVSSHSVEDIALHMLEAEPLEATP